MSVKTRPYWPALTYEAIGTGAMPRVLAEMRIGRYICSLRRGACVWWPPTYFRPAPPAFRVHQDVREAVETEWRDRERKRLGRLNRSIRDSPVRVHWCDDRILCLDEQAGDLAWRTMDGANFGTGLIDLGMWRWACGFVQAAYRIGRITGLEAPPLPVTPPAPRHAPQQEATAP